MAAIQMWTSKLGNKYPMAWMQENDRQSQLELKRLRGLKDSGNGLCSDCGNQDNTWASVSHGVFICVTCSDVHRSVGTHVTKVKGCTGTYLWGPDELEKMRSIGNRRAEELYGPKKISPNATKELKQQFVTDKYQNRLYVGPPKSAPTKPVASATSVAVASAANAAQPDKYVVRKTQTVEQATGTPAGTASTLLQSRVQTKAVAYPAEISDSFFNDFFNETQDSYFGNASVPLKSPGLTPSAGGDDSLDSFLNTTLHADVQTTSPAISTAPERLDPFADWADF